ncbi:WbqC family protein [Streptomyces sp. ND04-05B]|uniref:WbqC family protein n=1 Tax=Streptomyces sp. ND04-05B TaxID=3028693 RepID=UPI0029B4562E|nr:WbqC family protein [Streptomyces sp. ND04-05B]MDX3067120.1 WbqC family protein [Streptomyces sp. ND04-05B]
MCAIHQPNFFPRLSTLAKLYAADRWIVLDDVQFARRDYQHRARLAALDDPGRQQWLTLPTHLPHGPPTLINQALLAEPRRSRRTVSLLIRQFYGRSRHWPVVSEVLDVVLDRFEATDRVADIARTSTIALLTAIGWSGEVLDSSTIQTRQGRSERLVDLAATTSSTHYLCGTGGLRYLDLRPFVAHSIPVVPFHPPANSDERLWHSSRRASSLWALSAIGPTALAIHLASEREAHRSQDPLQGRQLVGSAEDQGIGADLTSHLY